MTERAVAHATYITGSVAIGLTVGTIAATTLLTGGTAPVLAASLGVSKTVLAFTLPKIAAISFASVGGLVAYFDPEYRAR
jgi:hypothetical protein